MAASRTLSQPSRPKQSWRADKPYNEIPLLPPTVDLETKAMAQASSEIENIVTTTDRLFQFRELHAQADPATKEASGALLASVRSASSARATLSFKATKEVRAAGLHP